MYPISRSGSSASSASSALLSRRRSLSNTTYFKPERSKVPWIWGSRWGSRWGSLAFLVVVVVVVGKR